MSDEFDLPEDGAEGMEMSELLDLTDDVFEPVSGNWQITGFSTEVNDEGNVQAIVEFDFEDKDVYELTHTERFWLKHAEYPGMSRTHRKNLRRLSMAACGKPNPSEMLEDWVYAKLTEDKKGYTRLGEYGKPKKD